MSDDKAWQKRFSKDASLILGPVTRSQLVAEQPEVDIGDDLGYFLTRWQRIGTQWQTEVLCKCLSEEAAEQLADLLDMVLGEDTRATS